MENVPNSPAGRPTLMEADFASQPFIVAWELTRACNLACVHCRAEAQLRRDPRELTTAEALAVIDDIARFDVPPVLVLTGGDPLRRPDLIELIGYASGKGLRVTLTPAGTPLASSSLLLAARDAGLARIAVSLDGPDAERHDSFRQTAGSFDWSLSAIAAAHAIGLPVQIHTTLCRRTVSYLPEMADLADGLAAVVWAVFCLVPTGRAQIEDELSAREYEDVFNWLIDRKQTAHWDLKMTEGYHFRRVLAQRGDQPVGGLGFRASNQIGRAPKSVNAGNGFCFISHVGDVQPSGFLPVTAGNVRQQSVVDLYRGHLVFRELRDPALLRGRCGSCEFRELCGGSRSRALAHFGDYLASDPACAYQPQA